MACYCRARVSFSASRCLPFSSPRLPRRIFYTIACPVAGSYRRRKDLCICAEVKELPGRSRQVCQPAIKSTGRGNLGWDW
ncbi:hypothetical protein DL98DRAFT_34231 [Cadophora sp. DSE1049]|nr:hypothetical protein DL98DRAFT_34231 [Cadophora sp. DSE1049]